MQSTDRTNIVLLPSTTEDSTNERVLKGRLQIEKALNSDKLYIPKDGKGVLMLYGGSSQK